MGVVVHSHLHLFNSEIRLPQNLVRKRSILNSTKLILIPGNVFVVPPLQGKIRHKTRGRERKKQFIETALTKRNIPFREKRSLQCCLEMSPNPYL